VLVFPCLLFIGLSPPAPRFAPGQFIITHGVHIPPLFLPRRVWTASGAY